MLNKIEHVGIAVIDISESEDTFDKLLGHKSYKHESIDTEGVVTSFYQIGESKLELLQSVDEKSAISKFLEKRGPGIHHIAFDVSNIDKEMERLTKEGFVLLNQKAFEGADNKLVCFIHPKSCNGILVELCQEIS